MRDDMDDAQTPDPSPDSDEDEWAVGFIDGREKFIAFGPVQGRMPVYEVVGGTVKEPRALDLTNMIFPACMKWLHSARQGFPLRRMANKGATKMYEPLARWPIPGRPEKGQ